MKDGNKQKYKEYYKKKKRKNVPESEYLTTMNSQENILEIEQLCTCFYTDRGTVRAVNGVTLDSGRVWMRQISNQSFRYGAASRTTGADRKRQHTFSRQEAGKNR